jgi:hypothetical protein
MSLLVRKIDKGKWLQMDIENVGNVSADAITNDLKTTSNKLSVWEIASSDDIDQAVLAMTAGGQHLETIDVVTIDPQHIAAQGIYCLSAEGVTPVDHLKNTHRELPQLSYSKLGAIAHEIVDSIETDSVQRRTMGELREILKKAILEGKLQPDRLSESLRAKLGI